MEQITRQSWDAMNPDEQWDTYCKLAQISMDCVTGWAKALTVNAQFTTQTLWNLVDDKGNPPPSQIYGDMLPIWYEGRWWVCYSEYAKRKQENGEWDRWGKELQQESNISVEVSQSDDDTSISYCAAPNNIDDIHGSGEEWQEEWPDRFPPTRRISK